MSSWMIYGANGYTGRLIALEALRRGHRPVLAGRSAEAVAELAGDLGLEHRIFPLDDPRRVAGQIVGQQVVCLAAGPFSRTSAPMVEACIEAGAHYVDITGEIPVFQQIFARDEAAKARRIALVPGGGFDVVPSDCLARYVADRLPGAVSLELDIDAGARASRGTARSMLEQLPAGIRVRRGGRLVTVPMGEGARSVRFPHGEKRVVPIPWGDLETAFRSTGIPDITTCMAAPPGAETALRLLGPLLQRAAANDRFRSTLDRIAGELAAPPDAEERARGRTHLHAVVSDGRGRRVEAWLEAPEAYAFTAMSAVRIVEKLLAERKAGAFTPAQAFGPDFVLEIPGVERHDELPER